MQEGEEMEHIIAKAWEFLTKTNLDRLPIDPLKLNQEKIKFKISAFCDSIDYLKSLNILQLTEQLNGFAVNDDGKITIFYDSTLPYGKRIMVICHEIGHIVLGHSCKGLIIGKSSDIKIKEQQEYEADLFATAFLAPIPVLVQLEATSKEEISQITGLPIQISKGIAYDVINTLGHKKTVYEKRLLSHFNNYIKDYTQHNKNIVVFSSFLLTLSVCITAIICIFFFSQNSIQSLNTNIPTTSIINESNNLSSNYNNSSDINNGYISSSSPSSLTSTIINNYYNYEVFYDIPNHQDNEEQNSISRVYSSEWPMDSLKSSVQSNQTSHVYDDSCVYATPNGNKYHKANCRYISGNNDLQCIASPSEAEQLGYTACKVCFGSK